MTMSFQEYSAIVGAHSNEYVDEADLTSSFPRAIGKQNAMYELAANNKPTLSNLGNDTAISRLKGFKATLQEELNEVDEIIERLERLKSLEAEYDSSSDVVHEAQRQCLVDIADWLADMTVYIRSEALKFGIPLEAVLACVMGSNFTKLGSDGKPIKNVNGKFLKGPNYQKPEPAIYATLFKAEELLKEYNSQEEASFEHHYAAHQLKR